MSRQAGSSGTTRRAMQTGLGAVAFGVHLLAAASVAYASPVTYSFTTGEPSLNSCLDPADGLFKLCSAPIYGNGTSVSGTFKYDSAVLQSGSTANTSALYAGSLTDLAGSSPSGFSDPSGETSVGNDVVLSNGSGDALLLAAESFVPAPFSVVPDDFVGFSIGGGSSLRLVNVRMFWMEGLLGAPDFLSDQSLPATLPTFEGRLALDFADVSSPSTIVAIVFFDGLFVHAQSVPEPASAALLGIASLALGIRRRALGRVGGRKAA